MENYKLEAKTNGNKITLSALIQKNKIVTFGGFQFIERRPEIAEIAHYEHYKNGKTTFVKVISNYKDGSTKRSNSNLSEK